MDARILAWLVCPLCRSSLGLPGGEATDRSDIETGAVECAEGHVFPVVGGVPRLLPGTQVDAAADIRSINQSFSREWQHFDYEQDRTWGQTVDERRADFLRHVDLPAEALAGKLVLDAGCGNGALSAAMATFECDVLATDISDSVSAARRHLGGGGVHFVQSDLMHPAVGRGIFDVVYCAGVLHHTPDTRATLNGVVDAVAPGGTLFVWLYWRVPGARARIAELLRRAISPLPAPIKHGVVATLLLPQAVAREHIRSWRRRGSARLNWREILVRQLDSFTPRYRWQHTPGEVHGWYRELGLVSIKTTEEGEWGFGVSARRPGEREGSAARETFATLAR